MAHVAALSKQLLPVHLGGGLSEGDWAAGLSAFLSTYLSLSFFFYFGHFWSLAAEEQFYLVWPLVVFLVKDRVWLRNICLAVCVLTPLARLACFHLIPHVYIDSGI